MSKKIKRVDSTFLLLIYVVFFYGRIPSGERKKPVSRLMTKTMSYSKFFFYAEYKFQKNKCN